MNDMSPIHIVPFYEAAAIKRRAIKPLMWQRNERKGLQRDGTLDGGGEEGGGCRNVSGCINV